MTSGKGPKLIAAGQVFDLHGQEIIIGRDATNHIAIADPSLSRRHCVLLPAGNAWTIRDLGSVNGVLVNGQRVLERRLADADHIAIGKTELLVRLDPVPEREPAVSDAAATVNLNLEDAQYLRPSGDSPELTRAARSAGTGTDRVNRRRPS